MISALMAYTPRQNRLIHLLRHYLQSGAAAINVSSMKTIDVYPPGAHGKYSVELTLASAPPIEQFHAGMEVMFRTSGNVNLFSLPIKLVDVANSKIVVSDENNRVYNNSQIANVIPWGVCPMNINTMDGTPIKNNDNYEIAMEYDEVGEFIYKMEKQDNNSDLLAIQVCASESITVAFKISLDGVNWNTPDSWTDVVVAADGVGLNGVDACPYGYTKIIFYEKIVGCWLRITTSGLAASGTYFINIIG